MGPEKNVGLRFGGLDGSKRGHSELRQVIRLLVNASEPNCRSVHSTGVSVPVKRLVQWKALV